MTNKELIEKLQQFPEDADVSLNFNAFTESKKVLRLFTNQQWMHFPDG